MICRNLLTKLSSSRTTTCRHREDRLALSLQRLPSGDYFRERGVAPSAARAAPRAFSPRRLLGRGKGSDVDSMDGRSRRAAGAGARRKPLLPQAPLRAALGPRPAETDEATH